MDSNQNLTVHGSKSFREKVTARSIQVFGNARFAGGMEGDRLDVQGSCRVDGLCCTQHLRTNGHARFQTVCAAAIEATGSFMAELVESGAFRLKGKLHLTGKLAAQEIHILQQVSASVKSAYASGSLIIHNDRGAILHWLLPGRRTGRYGSIKAPTVDINHIEASLVVGQVVRIGAHCKVNQVMYTRSLDITPGAQVREIIQVPETDFLNL